MQDTVVGTLPADTTTAWEANHGGIALDLAGTAGRTRLVGFEDTFPGFSGHPWLALRIRRIH